MVGARPAQAPLPEPPPPSSTRELPADPAAREAALAEVRPTAELILAISDVIATRLPPNRALSNEEKISIQKPLEIVLFKYDMSASPEWQLTAAVGMVMFARYIEVKAKAAGIDVAPLMKAAASEMAASAQTIEVKP